MNAVLDSLTQRHLDAVAAFFDSPHAELSAAARTYRRMLARYFNLCIPPDSSVLEIGCGDGELLFHLQAKVRTGIDVSSRQIDRARQRVPDAEFHHQAGETLDLPGRFDFIIVSDTLNFSADVEMLLSRLLTVASPETRLILNFQNNLWRPSFAVVSMLGLRKRQPQTSWLSRWDVANLLALSGWEVIKTQPRILWPFQTPVLSTLFNRWLAPLLPWLNLSVFKIARPVPRRPPLRHSVSVVIPARNEAGSIEEAARRTPEMGEWTELIFVEGNSRDATWAEIERVRGAFPERRIKALQQTGMGKGNAVREGFAVAEGEIVMILDADLTVPPETLPKFYNALASGAAEFANGSRLVYPMDKGAMQFLNMAANHLFGIAFSWMLQRPVKDTLCGTKVLWRSHYRKIAANRSYFGDFDPFGDFDLLFGADRLGLQIKDVPVRYRDRTYGSTNIQRWRHGWLLLRMVAFAARKLRFV